MTARTAYLSASATGERCMSLTVFVSFTGPDMIDRNGFKWHARNQWGQASFEILRSDRTPDRPFQGSDWKRPMARLIRNSDAVIAIMSPHSLESKGQEFEVQYGAREGIPILALRSANPWLSGDECRRILRKWGVENRVEWSATDRRRNYTWDPSRVAYDTIGWFLRTNDLI